MFSSPSRGSYISTLSACDDSSDFFSFSSPSRGSYILYETKVNYDGLAVFSSPSRGSYISTSVLMICRWHFLSSRPLPGVLISLPTFDFQDKWNNGSRPLPGVLISLPCPRNPLNYIRIFLLLRRKCNSIPYTDLIPHKIQDNVLFSTMRGKTGRYWEQ